MSERFTLEGIDWPEFLLHMQRYAYASDFCRGKSVLDCPTGEGYGAKYIAQYAASVVGVDISIETVMRCRETYSEHANLSYEIGDMSSLPFEDSSFDVVMCFEGIEHVPPEKQQACFDELRRVLKPEGIMLISTPDRDTGLKRGYNNPYHLSELSLTEFDQNLRKRFKNVEIFSQELNMAAGMWSISGRSSRGARTSKVDQIMVSGQDLVSKAGHGGFYYAMAVCSNASLDLPEAHYFSSYHREPALKLWSAADEAQTLKREIANKEENFQALATERDSYARKAQDLREAIKDKEEEILKIQAVLNEKSGNYDATIDNYENIISSLKAELGANKNELETYKNKYRISESNNIKMAINEEAANLKIKNFSTAVEKLKEELGISENNNVKLSERVDKLTLDIEHMGRTIEQKDELVNLYYPFYISRVGRLARIYYKLYDSRAFGLIIRPIRWGAQSCGRFLKYTIFRRPKIGGKS
jgi:SAM-dependent methyltransferase